MVEQYFTEDCKDHPWEREKKKWEGVDFFFIMYFGGKIKKLKYISQALHWTRRSCLLWLQPHDVVTKTINPAINCNAVWFSSYAAAHWALCCSNACVSDYIPAWAPRRQVHRSLNWMSYCILWYNTSPLNCVQTQLLIALRLSITHDFSLREWGLLLFVFRNSHSFRQPPQSPNTDKCTVFVS